VSPIQGTGDQRHFTFSGDSQHRFPRQYFSLRPQPWFRCPFLSTLSDRIVSLDRTEFYDVCFGIHVDKSCTLRIVLRIHLTWFCHAGILS
jgi:hypothetical protein